MKTILVKSNVDPNFPRLYVRNIVKETDNTIHLDEEVEMDEGPTRIVSTYDCYKFSGDLSQLINSLVEQALHKLDMATKLLSNLEPLAPPISDDEVQKMAQEWLLNSADIKVWH